MYAKSIICLVTAAAILGGVLPQSARADLPMLEQPWLGRFAVALDRNFKFYVSSNGAMELELFDRAGNSIGMQHVIVISLVAEEVAPGGVAASWLTVVPESLESADPATDKLRKTTLRGKMAGNDPAATVSFEATIEHNGSSILIGGRITVPGSFKNPVRLTVQAMFPPPYAAELQERALWDNRREKEFEKRTKRDLVELKHVDGTRSKQSIFEKINANTKEVNGAGIAVATVGISVYQELSPEFVAENNSAISLWNAVPAPLAGGFGLIWRADSAKDPEHTARLAIKVK